MFNLYSLALFIHIVGALGMFAAIAIEWTCLLAVRNSDNVAVVKQWLSILARLGKIHAPSWIAILISGIYMSASVWGFQNWILMTFGLILIMILLSAVLSGRRMGFIFIQVNKSGSLSSDIQQKLRDNALLYSVTLRTAVALDIILLMTIKPDLAGGLLSIFAAIVIGLLSVYFYNSGTINKSKIPGDNKIQTE